MSYGAYCIVLWCNNNKRNNPDVSFFTFPKNVEIAKKWLEFAERPDLFDDYYKKNYRICSNHFLADQFKCISPRTLLMYNACPSVKPNPHVRIKDYSQCVQVNLSDLRQGPEEHNNTTDCAMVQSTITKMQVEENEGSSETVISLPATPSELEGRKKLYDYGKSKRTVNGNPSCSTPSTLKKISQLKKTLNTWRCRLYRMSKSKHCICNGSGHYSSRSIVFRIMKEAKPFLSKGAYTLFCNEMKSSFRSKFQRRYDHDMKELCLLWYYAAPKGYRAISRVLNLPTTRTLRNWQSKMKVHSGINSAVLQSVKTHFEKNKVNQSSKIKSLVFDEIAIGK